MGLYLTIFAGDEELDGVEVGAYADFSAFRDAVVSNLEAGNAGDRFPTLILHSDCDGEWSPDEAAKLEIELKDQITVMVVVLMKIMLIKKRTKINANLLLLFGRPMESTLQFPVATTEK